MFNVLIADDEELERRAIRNIILNNFNSDCSIYEAKNGREAIELGERIRPDLVIIDIKMPGINGIEAIKEMHKNLPDTYFIIVTAYDYFNYAKEAIEYNVKQYILKPFKREDFTLKIRDALEYLKHIQDKRRRELELKEKLYSIKPVVKNELCSSIIHDRLSFIDFKLYQEAVNMSLQKAYSMAIRIISSNSFKLSIIREYIEELGNESTGIIAYCLTKDKIIAFCKAQEDLEGDKDSEDMARKIRRMLRDKFNFNTYIGIGSVSKDILELPNSYIQSEEALKYCGEKEKILHFNKLNFHDLSNQEFKEEPEHNKKMLNLALEYIRKNYNKEITLESISAHVNVSSFYFSKCFKESIGINFIDYLTEFRIEAAKDMLKKGEFNIKEICFEVGYSDPNYFSRVFKKIEGVSPTEYKSKML